MEQCLNTRLEAQSIQLLLNNMKSKEIKLDPIYQRGDVWSDRMRSDFIDSVLRGIIPSNIIFNKEYTDGKELLTCIDGKQRLTTLIMFRNNKIPHIEHRTNDTECLFEERETHTYFEKIPDDKKNGIVYNVLNDRDKYTLFLDRTVPVAFYSNLEYDRQVDIFSRINHSAPATYGELLLSKFSNNEVTNELNTFFKSIKFATDRNRNDNYIYVFNTMYMIHNENPKMLGSGTVLDKNQKKFIKEIDNLDQIRQLIKKCKKFISVYYSDKIIMNKKILRLNLSKNFIIMIGYFMYNQVVDRKIDIDQKLDNIIENMANLWNTWSLATNKYRQRNTTEANKRLKEEFDKYFPNTDSSSDSGSDSESGSDSGKKMDKLKVNRKIDKMIRVSKKDTDKKDVGKKLVVRKNR
jgi:hypothetical protein